MKLFKYILLVIFFISGIGLYAQNNAAKISGKIIDENRQPIPMVNISIKGAPGGTSSDDHGNYSLNIPIDIDLTIIFSFIGYKTEEVDVFMRSSQKKVINQTLFMSAKQL
ncbi:MAG: carboxypeptidase-like regulatory domain-containing protein, partial [Bacteroidales bacterium]|nr:carboxypeptidase-like regulatory domain-containing protein [Bacteroidales bacterium]